MAQMRGFFQFPQVGPQINGVPAALELEPGGIYYMPNGEYLVSCGSQTVIQWFDANNMTWRSVYPPGSIEQISADGGAGMGNNYRLVNMSGVTAGASITNAGSGGTNGIGPNQTGSTVTFGAPAAGGVTATAQGYVVVGGTVPAPTVTQGGSGFLVPPLIICDPPPQGGVQATFISTISSAGVLTGVTQTNPGAGYLAPPQFYIVPQPIFYPGSIRFPGDVAQSVPPPGLIHPNNVWTGSPYQGNIQSGTTGALLTSLALTGSGTLTGIVMTYYGNGYTSATIPAISFGGTSLGAAAATAVMSMCLVGASVTATGGTVFTVGDPIITGLGLVLATINNQVFTPRPGRGIVTNATGPVFSVEDPGFGIQKALGVNFGQANNGTATPTAQGTIGTASVGGINDVSIVQPMVQ